CGAARPTPSAAYIVSSISFNSLTILGVTLGTGLALARNTGSPLYRSSSTATLLSPFLYATTPCCSLEAPGGQATLKKTRYADRLQPAHGNYVDRQPYGGVSAGLMLLLEAASRL